MSSRDERNRPRFLTDENFNRRIIIGLRRLYPEIDLLTFAEAQLVEGISNPQLLVETARLDRILLSHDKRTMPAHFTNILVTWLPIERHLPGVLLFQRTLAIGDAIGEIALIWGASYHQEWRDRIVYLPI